MRRTPLAWALAAFVVSFWQAQFIRMIGWNSIELIIAQHVIDHGTYVTSLDYPSAITWRPALPTLAVAFVRLWVSDPIVIYQIVCGSSIGCLTTMMFLSARRIWGLVAAHVAAFFTLTFPAITTYLTGHFHSYSHFGALLLLGPAIYSGVVLLCDEDGPQGAGLRKTLASVLGGLAWAAVALCRSELLLFGLCFLALLIARRVRLRLGFAQAGAWAAAFLIVYVPYNAYVGHVAERDGLLVRKMIYQLYLSQGWVDPPPDVGPDIEADGYLYAKRLYGDPLVNNESVITAISNNPTAFLRRIRLNISAFYRVVFDPSFFRLWQGAAAIALIMLAFTPFVQGGERHVVLFCAGMIAATHALCVFQIDPRYLTIGVPAVILLSAGCCARVVSWCARLPKPAATILTAAIAAAVAWSSRDHLGRLWNHLPRYERGVVAIKAVAEHFARTAMTGRPRANREPHIELWFPPNSPVPPEDGFLLAYFTHTAWVNAGAEGAFPRGRFYSYRDSERDFIYVPASAFQGSEMFPDMTLIGEHENPIMGRFHLFQRKQG